jgi:hypothetical protein
VIAHGRTPRRQRGVAAVAAILVLVIAASYMLVRSLNTGLEARLRDDAATHRALAAAKQALLGYAATFPEHSTSTSAGPGRLPCPDYAYQGASDPVGSADSCSLAAKTETGLLPWRTLGLPPLVDGTGAPLWYAVSDNHRSNGSGVLNSDTAGTLVVDGVGDVVAVVVAPGVALPGQSREPADMASLYNPHNYLEDDNATTGDSHFVTHSNGAFDDEVVTITRGELMAAVEQRVLKDVARVLERYRADPDGDDVGGADPQCTAPLASSCDDGYPWLAPFANPATAGYHGVVGTRAGLLPLERVNSSFPAPFVFGFAIASAGTVVTSGSSPPDAQCVRASSCNFYPTPSTSLPLAGPIEGSWGPFSDGQCTWSAGQILSCTSKRIFVAGVYQVQRDYEFFFTKLAYGHKPPGAGVLRYRVLDAAGGLTLGAGMAVTIRISDTVLPNSKIGTTSLTLGAGDHLDALSLDGIPADLEVDTDGVIDPASARSPGELPAWFTANRWQQLVYVAYGAGYAPGAAQNCTLAGTCLTITRRTAPGAALETVENVPGVAVAAGARLATQARPSASLDDYFEDDNADGDTQYTTRPATGTFNDRLQVLTPGQ